MLVEAICAVGEFTPIVLTDSDKSMHGVEVNGICVLGGDDVLEALRRSGVEHAFVGVGSVGPGMLRSRLYEFAQSIGFLMPTIVHPSAIISSSAMLDDGVAVLARACVGPGTMISSNAIVNTGAIVEHDCSIGAHVHVSIGAVLAGGVCVASGTFVGAGAVIKQGVSIGASAVIGAGAVVVRNVPDGACVVGVPARQLK
ncbi:MAG: NeuD/PglB/VioB family sugar acetyltransferase [Verrucomicrobiae bacterium]|nr:NeuD/PglB/VioB family sugar acetyltransferase [Verrucomicrobiae bacterium]